MGTGQLNKGGGLRSVQRQQSLYTYFDAADDALITLFSQLLAFFNFPKELCPLLNYPNVCTNSPQSGKAFCSEHVQFLTEEHPEVPTDIHGFFFLNLVESSMEVQVLVTMDHFFSSSFLCSMICITCASKKSIFAHKNTLC